MAAAKCQVKDIDIGEGVDGVPNPGDSDFVGPLPNEARKITGEYQTGVPKLKTVYNPEVISTGEYLNRGLEAANNAASQCTNGVLPREWTEVDSQGVTWRGYFENGGITSYFPE